VVTEFLTVTTVTHLFMVMNHTANESKCYRATLEDGVLSHDCRQCRQSENPGLAFSHGLFYNDHTTTDLNLKTAFRMAYVLSQGSH
jgi:hypothetical protein